MRFKLLTVLAILLIVTLGHCRLAGSGQVVKNSYEDTFPNIDGDYLVWQGNVNGDWEIFLYNIATQELHQITDNDYGDISPQIDGNYVVWLGFSNSGGEIFLHDISSKVTTQITNDTNVDSRPQIANGRVVWASCEVTDSVEPGEVLLYDVVAKAKTCLSAPPVDPDGTLDDSFPRMNDESVIWVQADEAGNTTLFIHHFGNGTGPAPNGFVWTDSPQTDGDLTVSTRYDGNDREIFVYNASLQTYEQITDNDIEDRSPCVSGNNIAWVGGEGSASEIFINADLDPIDTDGPSGSAPRGGGSSSSSGGCFIATAAFGSYTHPHVQVIRGFREEYLLTNMPGRWFVSKYNTYSPFCADLVNGHPWCKPFVRVSLMPLVGTSYFLVETSLATKLLTGFLLAAFIVTFALRIRGR